VGVWLQQTATILSIDSGWQHVVTHLEVQDGLPKCWLLLRYAAAAAHLLLLPDDLQCT
jgi:hypothetical protein